MVQRLELTRDNHTRLDLRLAGFGNFCINSEDESKKEKLYNAFKKMSLEQNDLLVANDETYKTIVD